MERAAGALPRPVGLSKGRQESQLIQLAMRTSGSGTDARAWHVLALLAPRRLHGLSWR